MSFPFLRLPAEIREHIYRETLYAKNVKIPPPPRSEEPPQYNFDLSILRANRLIHREAKKIFEDNIFIKISTPWVQSIEHINNEGKVPLVSRGTKALPFKKHHLHVYIDTPDPHYRDDVYSEDANTVSMITTLDDLASFTAFWRYADLNHQQSLNPHLRLRLRLRDPHVPSRKLPRLLQEQLLLPFEHVKGLGVFAIDGEMLLPSIQSRLAELRKLHEPTAAECIQRGVALKEEGNRALEAGNPLEALSLYNQSFAAIHIIVKGRLRTVHADGFFCTDMPSETHTARLLLRFKLVANIVLAYLKMKNWTEAHFWGKRTIVLFRSSMRGFDISNTDFLSNSHIGNIISATDDDNSNIDIVTGSAFNDNRPRARASMERGFLEELAMTRFPAQAEMGKIFFRTALAAREMGKMADVKTMIKAASVYLPHDETVQAENRKLNMEEEERKRTEGEAVF